MLKYLRDKKYTYPLLLFIIVLVLFVRNYVPGTWLSGWDNIHPEFGLKAYFLDKVLFSVWQESYGLGSFIGNATITDIVRFPFYAILKLVFSDNLVRYIWHFSMLYIGVYFSYKLILYFLGSLTDKKVNYMESVSFIGAVFYLINIATVQNFYVPIEAFSHFYAFLPALLLVDIKYFRERDKQTFKNFILINILAIPSFYIPTLFIVYFLVLLSVVFGLIVASNKEVISHSVFFLKQSFYILILNLFWLVPFIIFIYFGGAKTVSESKIYSIFSRDALVRSDSYGELQDIVSQFGIWFSTTDIVDGNYIYMMRPWIVHFNSVLGAFSLYYFIALSIFGLFGLFYLRSRYRFSLLFAYFLVIAALSSPSSVLGVVVRILRDYVPLFGDVFRLSFTKFAVPLSLISSILVAFSLYSLRYMARRFKEFYSNLLIFVVSGLLLVIYMWPSFGGNFIYREMKVNYPEEYFKLFKFFDEQPINDRIANFPQPSFSGWSFFSWGYRGSGFAWYGIQQPILDRAFDIWNSENEQYYDRIGDALYTKNIDELIRLFDKYNVSWVWVDASILYKDNPSLLYVDELKQMLEGSSRFKKAFSTGNQTVYELMPLEDSLVNSSSFKAAAEEDTSSVLYPFDKGDIDFIEYSPNEISFKSTAVNGELNIPSIYSFNEPVYSDMYINDSELLFTVLQPKVTIDSVNIPLDKIDTISYSLPLKLEIGDSYKLNVNDVFYSFTASNEKSYLGGVFISPNNSNKYAIYAADEKSAVDFTRSLLFSELNNCNYGKEVQDVTYELKYDKDTNEVVLIGKNSSPCLHVPLNELKQSFSTGTASIVNFDFKYKLSFGTRAELCIKKPGDEECLSSSFLQPSDEYKTVSLTYDVSSYNASDLEFVVILHTYNEGKKMLSISNASMYAVDSAIVNSPLELNLTTSSLLTGYETNLGQEVKISFEYNDKFFPYTVNAQDFKFNSSVKGHCTQLGLPLNSFDSKKDIIEKDSDEYFELKTTGGVACRSIVLKDVNIPMSFINKLTYQNTFGGSIVYCIKSTSTGHCFVNEVFPDNPRDWETYNFFVPNIIDGNSNLSLMASTYSASRKDYRVDRIKSSVFYPVSGVWLKSLKYNTNLDNLSVKTATAERILPFIYYYEGSADFVTLNQAYNRGWVSIFGGDHFIYNDWEDAWELGLSDRLLVIFLPQVLALFFLIIPIYYLYLFLRDKYPRT